MERDDADVVLMYVTMNSIRYRDPVDDIMFAAHKSFTRISPMKYANGTFYNNDNPLSVVGCIEQVSNIEGRKKNA